MRVPLWPLKQILRSVPDLVHAETVGRLANHLMRGQIFAGRLAPLEGKSICLAVEDTGNRLNFRIENGRLRRQDRQQPWDVLIQGNLADFLLLATRTEDADTLFFARRLSLQGDTEAGLYVKNLLDALEFDWESHLASVLGATAAEPVVRAIKAVGIDRAALTMAQFIRAALAETAAPANSDSQPVWNKAKL